MYTEGSLEYKIEKVYSSLFGKKFGDMVVGCQRESIVAHLKFYTENGCIGMGIGWDEQNHTIVDLDSRGVHFNNDESLMYSFDIIAELLIRQYGKTEQIAEG